MIKKSKDNIINNRCDIERRVAIAIIQKTTGKESSKVNVQTILQCYMKYGKSREL